MLKKMLKNVKNKKAPEFRAGERRTAVEVWNLGPDSGILT
jgi:hypothetical protein